MISVFCTRETFGLYTSSNMLISYNWLSSYFTTPLPQPEKVAELLTFKAFEIESVVKEGSDTIIDVKVLPDRAHYALSHRGIAYEVSAITGLPLKDAATASAEVSATAPLVVNVESSECNRYIARRIENVTVGVSSPRITERLAVVGGRPINSVVDATNYIMFDIGQPLHVFDADLVKGKITVRNAKEGEKLTTLDGKEVMLSASAVVIADEEGILAIAGIKGGNRAQVTEHTKNLILESANFAAAAVRRTASYIGIRTDASKRFENAVSPEIAAEAMERLTTMIMEANPGAKAGPAQDVYTAVPEQTVLTVRPERITSLLGINIPTSDIIGILHRLQIETEDTQEGLVLHPPLWRRDLVILQDVVDEVGRLYGLEKIPSISLPPTPAPALDTMYFYKEKIRAVLVQQGFSEVYLPTLVDTGDVAVANPLASDKKALRSNLAGGIVKALSANTYNAPLLGIDMVKIFELGTTFTASGEELSLALGVHDIPSKGKKNAVAIEEALAALGTVLGAALPKAAIQGGVIEMPLKAYIASLPEPESEPDMAISQAVTYSPISPYPFVLRDIAVFTPESITAEDVAQVIDETAGEFLVRKDLFDVFRKEFPEGPKISYAYHLVFQSSQRTLTDNEVNAAMAKTEEAMRERGWQVR